MAKKTPFRAALIQGKVADVEAGSTCQSSCMFDSWTVCASAMIASLVRCSAQSTLNLRGKRAGQPITDYKSRTIHVRARPVSE